MHEALLRKETNHVYLLGNKAQTRFLEKETRVKKDIT